MWSMFRGHGGSWKGAGSCWHWAKYVLRACSQLKRGFEVLALCEICFEGMGGVEKGL